MNFNKQKYSSRTENVRYQMIRIKMSAEFWRLPDRRYIPGDQGFIFNELTCFTGTYRNAVKFKIDNNNGNTAA